MNDNETGWVNAATRGQLGKGDVLGIVIDGREIALYDLDGTVYASDDICTHAYVKLSDGWLDKREIECPLHAGRFDIKTGRATSDRSIIANPMSTARGPFPEPTMVNAVA